MKSIRFITIKKKAIVAVILSLISAATLCATYFPIKASAMPKPIHNIVIDAGHGGIDGGAVGKTTGISESQLNLDYSKTLQKMCLNFGIGVTMTRSDMNGLYAAGASNKKRSEMEKRKQIIENSGAELVVSIHMNSFPLTSSKGAQVFYGANNEGGKKLAESVQKSICYSFTSARKTASVGDYFILNCHNKPGIIVECGFLSNPNEELLLCDKNYREEMCYSILSGILNFYSM